MTKPTDDLSPYHPYGWRITLLQFLSLVAVAGVALSLAAHYFLG